MTTRKQYFETYGKWPTSEKLEEFRQHCSTPRVGMYELAAYMHTIDSLPYPLTISNVQPKAPPPPKKSKKPRVRLVTVTPRYSFQLKGDGLVVNVRKGVAQGIPESLLDDLSKFEERADKVIFDMEMEKNRLQLELDSERFLNLARDLGVPLPEKRTNPNNKFKEHAHLADINSPTFDPVEYKKLTGELPQAALDAAAKIRLIE